MAKGKDRKRKRGGRGGSRSSGGGGTMSSMRSGLKGLVGTRKGPAKKKHPVWNVVSWILVLAVAALAVYLFVQRQG